MRVRQHSFSYYENIDETKTQNTYSTIPECRAQCLEHSWNSTEFPTLSYVIHFIYCSPDSQHVISRHLTETVETNHTVIMVKGFPLKETQLIVSSHRLCGIQSLLMSMQRQQAFICIVQLTAAIFYKKHTAVQVEMKP